MRLLKNIYIAIIIFLTGFNFVHAQDETVTVALEKCQSKLDSLRSLELEVRNLNDRIDILCDSLNVLEKLNASSSLYQDSLLSVNIQLEDSLMKIKNLYEYDEKVLSTLDMIRARYVGARLQLKYVKERVDEALYLYDGIRDKDINEKFKNYYERLKEYHLHNDSLKHVLEEIDSDPDATDLGNFSQWKSRSLQKLKNTDYYKNVYKDDYSVKINYLDDIIAESEKRITDAPDPRYYGHKTVDLSDLRNKL